MTRTEFRIGDLARETGTKVVTIRYYEKIGLLPPAGRSAANYRRYGTAALERLRFIQRCRALGFSVDQVRELLALSMDEVQPCEEVDAIAAVHLAEVERKITELQALAGELRRISASCGGGGPISTCRTLDALAPG